MQKILLAASATILLMVACQKNASSTTTTNNNSNTDTTAHTDTVLSAYNNLVWSDEFNTSGNFDAAKWAFATKATSAWNKYLVSDANYAHINDTALILKMDNSTISGNSDPYHTCGIRSMGKFSFTYGKLEVRAKFNQAQGSWPAIWLMPESSSYGGWPMSGEIDLMEHWNVGASIGQTVHYSGAVNVDHYSSNAASFNLNDYNIYTLVWKPTAIYFYVNNVLQYTYSKAADATSAVWPFDKPFYIILNMSGGAGSALPVTDASLPFTMSVDYVRVYN